MIILNSAPYKFTELELAVFLFLLDISSPGLRFAFVTETLFLYLMVGCTSHNLGASLNKLHIIDPDRNSKVKKIVSNLKKG